MMSKKIRNMTLRLLIFFILILLLLCGFAGCRFEKLGLTDDSNKKTNTSDANITNQSTDSKNESSFFELKGKQQNKNLLNDINIRKAIFLAIDRERIAKELLGSYGEVLNSIFQKDSAYYDPAWEMYSYNLEEAKNFLKKAGYDKDNPLYLTIGANNDSPARKQIEEYIKEDLEKIGINIWIIDKGSKEWYIDYVKSGNYELGIWSLYTPDCNSIVNYFSSEKIPPMESDTNKNCNNFYWFKDVELDKALESFCNESNNTKKIELSKEVQNILASDAIILPLYSRIYSVAYNKKIKNIDINTADGSFLYNIEKLDIDTGSDSSNKNINLKSMMVGYEEEPYTLNPVIPDNIYRNYITSLVVKGLWDIDKDGNYIPLMVDEISSVGSNADIETNIKNTLIVNIKLKNNIYWQDGTLITSADVITTLEALISDENVDNPENNYKIIKDLKIINDREFNVVFNQYDINWKGLFSIVFPRKIILTNKISSLFENDLFGCGPYKLKEWVKGNYILLEKNEFYFGEKPKIDSIKFIFNSDINYLIGMLKDGTLDVISIPADLKLMEDIKNNKNLGLLVKQGNLWEHLAICLKPK